MLASFRGLRAGSVMTPLFASLVIAANCGGEIEVPADPPVGQCDVDALAFEAGDPNGHADPLGAKAAGQARAGRIQAADVPQPAHGKFRIEDGDFLLINDKIAIVIEDKDLSDGYARFGGEILSVDRVGDDGKPLGRSLFLETLQLTSANIIEPESLTVLNDGSDGQAAVIRARGTLKPLPFLADTFGAAFPKDYVDLSAVVDYVLEPGAEKIEIRYGVINPDPDFDIDTGLNYPGSWELLGFFQTNFSKLFVPGTGFGDPNGFTDFIAFTNGDTDFAYLGPDGAPLEYGGVSQSGFQLFAGEGLVTPGCTASYAERFELVVGEAGRGLDGVGQAVRRSTNQPEWREVSGTVTDADGPVAFAFVHVLSGSEYLVRTQTAADGSYRVHVPPGQTVSFVPQLRGYPASQAVSVTPATSTQDLTLGAVGTIRVVATEFGSATALPVRVQVIPTDAMPATPAAYGLPDERNGRLHQDFAVTGSASLKVPVGEHRVIVSRGYEWELHDETVQVGAGDIVAVTAALEHSVDTTNVMSADFHIHSAYSPDSDDPVDYKIKGVIADGLDIPLSSEHEWIIDFQPLIESLGLTAWARGLPSQELTTFTWGHFGVVPINPRPGEYNNGARDWLNRTPADVFAELDTLPEQPALIINHPSGSAGFSSYFTKVQLDRATGTSSDPLWDENFDAIEVFNDSDFESNRDESVADWFALLNAGKTFWAVGSSDSHKLISSPAGYPRTFLALGYDDTASVTPEDVRDAVKQGRSTIGGGMYMSIVGPNASAPGDSVPASGNISLTVTVRAPSWVNADSLEIIVNGQTVITEPLAPMAAGTGQVFVNVVNVAVPSQARSWVIAHAKGGDLAPLHPGKTAFAVSNPIFLTQ